MDDKSKTGQQDRDRINTSEPYELRYWALKWDVSEDELRQAVQRVGPMVKDVGRHLGK